MTDRLTGTLLSIESAEEMEKEYFGEWGWE